MQPSATTSPKLSLVPPLSDEVADPAELFESIELGLEGSKLQRMRYALGQAAAYVGASIRGDRRQSFLASLRFANAFAADSFPRIMKLIEAQPGGAELLEDRPAMLPEGALAQLRAFPADTLGGAYVRFLDARGIDPNFNQHGDPSASRLAWVRSRMFMVHDLWHVIANIDIHPAGEVGMAAFSAGQMRGVHSVKVLTLVYGLMSGPAVFPLVWRAYRSGRQAKSLLAMRWESLWTLSLAEIRERLELVPNQIIEHTVDGAPLAGESH